jgi:hypothetical protein
MKLNGIKPAKFAIFEDEGICVSASGSGIGRPDFLKVMRLSDGRQLCLTPLGDQPAATILRVPTKKSLVVLDMDGRISMWELK